jgi:endonuclease YncB( thermonuclease family)
VSKITAACLAPFLKAGLAILLSATSVLGLLGCIGENRHAQSTASEAQRPVTPMLAPQEIPQLGTVASVKVSKVFDGDTFEFKHEGLAYHVRLSGIDAPERSQDFADQARQALRKWTDAQWVRIEVLKIDQYKRLVCKVQIESGPQAGDLSLRLVQQGLAWHFKRYAKDQGANDRQLYAQAEDKARAAKLGLWADEIPLAPWLFREQQRSAKSKG